MLEFSVASLAISTVLHVPFGPGRISLSWNGDETGRFQIYTEPSSWVKAPSRVAAISWHFLNLFYEVILHFSCSTTTSITSSLRI